MCLNIADYSSNVNHILKIILPTKKDDLAIASELAIALRTVVAEFVCCTLEIGGAIYFCA
jgi:hypothetical protein